MSFWTNESLDVAVVFVSLECSVLNIALEAVDFREEERMDAMMSRVKFLARSAAIGQLCFDWQAKKQRPSRDGPHLAVFRMEAYRQTDDSNERRTIENTTTIQNLPEE